MRLLFLAPLIFTWSCTDETISGYSNPEAIYALAEINGEPFDKQATISFPKEGVANGNGPCNSWTARQTAPYPWIDLGPIASTKRACGALQAEHNFFNLLENATLAEVVGETLILTLDNGAELVFFALK